VRYTIVILLVEKVNYTEWANWNRIYRTTKINCRYYWKTRYCTCLKTGDIMPGYTPGLCRERKDKW